MEDSVVQLLLRCQFSSNWSTYSILPRLKCQKVIFIEIDRLMLKFTLKSKDSKMIRAILKKNKVIRLILLDFKTCYKPAVGLPQWLSAKEFTCCAPWVRKIPWRRGWQLTLIFLPGESLDRGSWRATVHSIAESGQKQWEPSQA